jgi:hypothetical protein
LARRDATIRTHVLPEWDEVALSGVVNADVRAWAARLHAEGLSAYLRDAFAANADRQQE